MINNYKGVVCMNMLIGKRQLILASLVVALGIAVYLNWQFADSGSELALTNKLEIFSADGEEEIAESAFGEAYFAEAKLTRTQTRDEALEVLTSMIERTELSDEQKTELTAQAAAIAKAIEVEGKLENLIRAKGFADAMVYYDGDGVDVTVRTEGLLTNEVVQIKEIILNETDVEAENISIMEVK